ncbi:MAG: DUF3376 domain-containing protein, partial [Chloroflexi bacterium]|nr:DUF3376 domain-containing protein [Chloroflexota bacterium]
VVERNQLIQRVNNIVSRFKFIPRVEKGVKTWQNDARLWTKKYFDKDLLNWFGSSYATYHQLRVASVLEGLKSAVLRAFNWNENGKEAENLATLLEGWRRFYYTTDPRYKKTHWSENDILYRFDTIWRMRRIQYMQGVINQLLEAVYASAENSKYTAEEHDRLVKQANKVVELSGVKFDIFELDNEKARSDLTGIKKSLNDAYGYLRARGRQLRSQSLLKKTQKDEQLQVYINELTSLKKYLEGSGDGDPGNIYLNELAEKGRSFLQETSAVKTDIPELVEVFGKLEAMFSSLAVHLDDKTGRGYVRDSLSLASSRVRSAIGGVPKKGQKDERTDLQKCLYHYFDHFEYYDMLIFPVYYGTGVEESDEAEIIRISPEDATSLFNEKKAGSKKLAGTAVANFGAFFAQEWRENDMMWGRLDGAECLVKALQAESDERAELIEEIHQSILQDELTPRDEVKVFQTKHEVEKAAVGKYKSRFGLQDGQAEWLYKAIHRLSKPEKLTENFRNGYSIDRGFQPRDTLLAGSRAMRVFGNLLNGLSGSYKSVTSPAKWVTAIGSIIAGILAVALPNSMGNFLVAGYWIWLLYVFEILLGGAGWLFGAKDVQGIGVSLFALTAAAHLFLTVVNRWLSGRINQKLFRILISVLIFLLIVGVFFLLYVGLLDLGILKIPEGLFGDWLLKITNDCSQITQPDTVLSCRPAE